MKTLSLMLLLFLLVDASSAQNSSTLSNPPDVAVLEKNWRLEIRDPALDDDPFRANDDHDSTVRAQRENDRMNAIRIKKGSNPEPYVPPAWPIGIILQAPSSTYIYSVKIRNTGAKTIRVLVWEYMFIEPDTQKEVGNHRYTSKVNIHPSKCGNVVERSVSPPNMIIDAGNVGKKLREQLSERVVIHRIEYADGSFWQRPSN